MPKPSLPSRFLPALLLPLLIASSPVLAQDPAAALEETFGHSRHGSEFDEGPRQAAYLMDGMSAQVHFPITTENELAQRFFDQGICQQHGFWYFESERSFRQVARLDPGCAMAYWGMCLANRDHHERAAGFITQAVQRSAQVSERERLWIDAWAGFYQVDEALRTELQSGDAERVEKARAEFLKKSGAAPARDVRKRLARDLVRGIEAVVALCPDDVEAKAFLAVQCWYNLEYGVEISSHGAVDALLDQVFAAAPLHPAHHFRVHLWDREKAERAVRSAATLGRTAPAIAHQWHMGGHIFAKLDRHDDAAWQQEASARTDHAHMMRDRVMPYEIHNYGHNNEWLCRSLMHTGRVREALALARNMVELPRHPKDNKPDDGRDIAGYGRARLLDVCRDYELWDELLRCCEGPWLPDAGEFTARAERLEALGIARFRLGDAAAGAAVIAALDALIDERRAARAAAVDEAEAAALAADKRGKDVQDAMAAALAAAGRDLDRMRQHRQRLCVEQAIAAGDLAAAAPLLEQLQGEPALEMAWLQRQVGKLDAAIESLTKEVEQRKGRVLPLAHLIEALSAAGRDDDAREHFATLRALATRAELSVPPLRRLQPIAVALGLPADWRGPVAVRDDVGDRPDLAQLGPFRWQPVAAPQLSLPMAAGGTFDLEARPGRPVLIVFYLGFGCLHCVEQLHEFAPRAGEFAALGIDIVAVGTESAAAVGERVRELGADAQLPFTLLCDPELQAFRAYRAHDDFEDMALHSTVLIDGDGLLRWQDISFEPFRDVEWLLGECERLLAMPAASGSK